MAFGVDDEIQMIQTRPTRGGSTRDFVFSNVGAHVTEAGTLPSLETEKGVVSDHMCVEIAISMPKGKDFTYIRKTTRKRMASADERLADNMHLRQWENDQGVGIDGLVQQFAVGVGQLKDKHFPLQMIRRRSNKHPWVTNGIRRRAKRKKRMFRRMGRSEGWKRAEKSMSREIVTVVGRRAWSVMDLFPGKGELEFGAEVIDFFAGDGGDEPPNTLPSVPQVAVAMSHPTPSHLSHKLLTRGLEILKSPRSRACSEIIR